MATYGLATAPSTRLTLPMPAQALARHVFKQQQPGGLACGILRRCEQCGSWVLRAPDGTITTFDAPDAGAGPGLGTQGIGINPSSAITGLYVDASNVTHGFLLDP